MTYEKLFDKLSKIIEEFAKEKGYENVLNHPGEFITYENNNFEKIELTAHSNTGVDAKIFWQTWKGDITIIVEHGCMGFPYLRRCELSSAANLELESLEYLGELFSKIESMCAFSVFKNDDDD